MNPTTFGVMSRIDAILKNKELLFYSATVTAIICLFLAAGIVGIIGEKDKSQTKEEKAKRAEISGFIMALGVPSVIAVIAFIILRYIHML